MHMQDERGSECSYKMNAVQMQIQGEDVYTWKPQVADVCTQMPIQDERGSDVWTRCGCRCIETSGWGNSTSVDYTTQPWPLTGSAWRQAGQWPHATQRTQAA